ncbi:Motile sperm domain-containing protein 2-like protein [Dinothrombium tinctorium]|uniref:Motile sperm domain-containing protein 2-like protein n=1 Tax=Dinothrombium tinctorium TaxID=1965070 RepID=A0A3S3PCD7_9ACAR|nr:Motile sperm domain-containing protein 2-like protein [Dinothrombium tinctorium]RWS09802.1 Motile sperm domain-containing protein 2-like protein [Dinothrombium tinctorium]RWS13570.1 Motile sperm domain-containing protein 2-like protein [Dinothrombium tinctorium]RWS13579.1 Motile sperm domain-containing protein 2-like protein [Dinothrombium tinctorium]
MQWRKKNEVAQMSEKTFPYEFHEVGGIYPFGEDVNGNVVLHVRIRLFIRVPPILELLKRYTIYHLVNADEMAARKGRGWILLLDCTDTGFANSDLEMANFLVSVLRNYFPSGQKYILIHNLPWFLNAIKNVVFTMLPSNVKRRIKSSNERTITEYISLANLPDYLNGEGGDAYRVIPANVKTTVQLAKEGTFKLSEDDLQKVAKYYEKVRDIINETKKIS